VFDHVTIRVSDLDASRRFYELALGEPTHDTEHFTEWDDFGIAQASDERPLTRRLHVGFAAPERYFVDEWWRRMTAAGYENDGEPGVRPQYHESYYGAFVRDPDGNSVESVHHHTTKFGAAVIDHLWLRSRDVDEAERFYGPVAPVVGHRIMRGGDPDRVRLSDGTGAFSFVDDGEPTENVHLAFGVPDRRTVENFHRVATAGGFEDNGASGERPQYHPGYYAAFVLDPDGHNVEAVFHDRPV
jgi:catechol 2,3-dioxygenase-like lactoylglutathione lyase family enzyme